MKSAEDLLAEITDPFMKERLASIRQGIQKRQKRQHQKPKSAEIVQFPLWPEPARGVPNSALRGALFAAIQGKNRQYLKNRLLAVQDGVRIKFTGEQLDQSDMDVWEQILGIFALTTGTAYFTDSHRVYFLIHSDLCVSFHVSNSIFQNVLKILTHQIVRLTTCLE
jgi:hypothetical protein